MSLHLVMFLIALIWVALFAFYLYASREHARLQGDIDSVHRLLERQADDRG
jgi:hypothetical protein